MTQSDLVNLLANVITDLDGALMSAQLLSDPPTWQLVYALRKHLDDQQRDLLKAVLEEENQAYGALTATILAASTDLDQVIGDMQHIDNIVKDVASISAAVDQVLNLVP